MKRKQQNIFIIILLVGIIILAVIRLQPAEKTNCRLDSLALDEIKMHGWETQIVVSSPILKTVVAQQAYSIVFKQAETEINQVIYQYRNDWLATFHTLFEREFHPSATFAKWWDLEVENLSQLADEEKVKCSYSQEKLLPNICILSTSL